MPLTPKAFDVLAALVEQPGRLISKEELLQKVWPDTFVEESNLAYNVFALRKALGDTADNGQYIETIAKRGYRFTATVTRANRGNGGSPSPEGVAEAPVPEAVRQVRSFTRAANRPNYQRRRMFGGTSLAVRFGRPHGSPRASSAPAASCC